MAKHLFSFLISFVFFLLSSAFAGIIRVPQDHPGIQAGINAATNSDTVLVADSTYYENINFMGKAITVASYYIMDQDTNHISSTIINGSQPTNPNAASVVTFESGEDTTSILYGFTITAGSGKWYATAAARVGGGIYCYNSGCKIIANKIINNIVNDLGARGGGMGTMPLGSNACVVLKKNQIKYNLATANIYTAFGGGVWLTCHAKIDSNLISYNSCISDAGSSNYFTMGGGICCYSQPPYSPLEILMEYNTVTHNSVSNNSVPSNQLRAGGVQINGCNGRLANNEICYNEIWNYSNLVVGSVGVGVGGSTDIFLIESNNIHSNAYMHGSGNCYGGGLQVYGPGAISVINNLIEGNVATYGGGVIVANNITYPGQAVLANNTIVNNTATYGGGIYIHESTAQVMNNIIWDNHAPTNAAIYTYNSTIEVAYSDVQDGWPGYGNISKEPMLRGENFILSDSSSCIGAGILSYQFGSTTVTCPPTCLLGHARPSPSGTNPDIGACESLLRAPVVGFDGPLPNNLPLSYDLKQNYPNPFNPTTVISWQLAVGGPVKLLVFDLAGRRVATLVDGHLPAGNHSVVFDGSELASGTYFYQIIAGQFSRVRKMLLLR